MCTMKRSNYLLLIIYLMAFGVEGRTQELLWTGDSSNLRIRRLFSSPSGNHWGAIVEAPDGVSLVIDGKELKGKDDFGALHLKDDGDFTFWFRDGEEELLATPNGNLGPGRNVRVPDLSSLRAAGEVSGARWAHRGGTRSVFGASKSDGSWTRIMRFPASPGFQEEGTLSLSRLENDGPSPSSTRAVPLRFGLVDDAPAFVFDDGSKQCLWWRGAVRGCGERVALVAVDGAGKRLDFAVQTSGGLELVTPEASHGPTQRVDWLAYSADGAHMAFVMQEGRGEVLMVDGKPVASFPRIQSLAWTPRGLAFLAHLAGSSVAVVGDTVVAEERVLESLMVGPDGEVVIWGKSIDGAGILAPLGAPEGLAQLWGAGFLSGGQMISNARFSTGHAGYLLDGKPLPGLTVVVAPLVSPDGDRWAVIGRGPQGPLLFLDGQIHDSGGRAADDVEWCGETEPRIRVRSTQGDCVSRGNNTICCTRIVFTGCLAEGKVGALCMSKSGYQWRSSETLMTAPYDEVPLSLVYSDRDGGEVWFAARRKDKWYRVRGDCEHSLQGKPLSVEAGDGGPWYRIHPGGKRLWTAPGFTTAAADNVFPPFFSTGHSVSWAAQGGREYWVVDGVRSKPYRRIFSAPKFYDGGFLFVALDTDGLSIVRQRYRSDEKEAE